MLFPKIFDIFLALSFITLVYIVQRLYLALRVLNARVTILSSLVKEVGVNVKEMGVEEEALSVYKRRDERLQEEMRGDFSYKEYTHAEIRTIKAHSLVRPEAIERLTGSFPQVTPISSHDLPQALPSV